MIRNLRKAILHIRGTARKTSRRVGVLEYSFGHGTLGSLQVKRRCLSASERVQKRNQISFLLGCKTNIKTHVVKDKDIGQR
jgi:hypothetical protein